MTILKPTFTNNIKIMESIKESASGNSNAHHLSNFLHVSVMRKQIMKDTKVAGINTKIATIEPLSEVTPNKIAV